MKNKLSSGKLVNVTLTAAVASGEGRLIGKLFGVAVTAGAVGDTVAFDTSGEFDLPAEGAASGQVLGQGDEVFWDAAAKRVTATAASNTLIGHATVAKASTATEATVRIR